MTYFNNIIFIGNMNIIDVVFRGTTSKQCDLASGRWFNGFGTIIGFEEKHPLCLLLVWNLDRWVSYHIDWNTHTWIMDVSYMLDVHEIANVNLPMHGHVDLIAWYHEKTWTSLVRSFYNLSIKQFTIWLLIIMTRYLEGWHMFKT